MKNLKKISVTLPTYDGFISRECNNSKCNKYFKVSEEFLTGQMYCPYCCEKQDNDELNTQEQLKYAQDVAIEQYTKQISNDIDKLFSGLNRKNRKGTGISITYKSKPYKPKIISSKGIDKIVDSEILCPECKAKFQVYGIFGYCPLCRYENIQIYDANLAIIEQEIENSSNPNRALRHAYYDLVSVYEHFCLKKSKEISENHGSFQELFEPRKFFKKESGTDIFQELLEKDILILRRVFQKRHAYVHANGKITEKYIRKVPEDKNLLGMQAELSIEEFKKGAYILRTVISNVVSFKS